MQVSQKEPHDRNIKESTSGNPCASVEMGFQMASDRNKLALLIVFLI